MTDKQIFEALADIKSRCKKQGTKFCCSCRYNDMHNRCKITDLIFKVLLERPSDWNLIRVKEILKLGETEW